MNHPIADSVRELGGSLLLIAGLSLMGWQALLLEWWINAGQESDIQARGPLVAAMLLPYIIFGVMLLLIALLAVTARRRRMSALRLVSAVVLAAAALFADLFSTGGVVLFGPVVALSSVVGNVAIIPVVAAELLGGFLLLNGCRREPASTPAELDSRAT